MADLYVQRDQPPGVPPLHLTGERTLPDVPEENYWFRRHLAVYGWIGARVHGRRVVDLACGEGYGSALLARTAASVVGVDANPDAFEHARLKYTQPGLTFERDMIETWTGDVDCVVFLQTIEHVQDPDAVLARLRDLVGPGRRRLRLDAERAHAGAGGRGALGQPVARARVPAGGVPRAVRPALRRASTCSGSSTRASCACTSSPSSAPAGTRSTPGCASPSRSTTASRPPSPRATSAAARAPGPRARPARRAAAMRPAPGALAIVLHTHMPYVEGFGTWPFGEEWLWEAVATCYLPLLDVLDAAPGRVTLSVTPVLGDQLEAPGALARCLAFLREIRPASHRLDLDAADRPGRGGGARVLGAARTSGRRSGWRTRRPRRRGSRRHATWTSSATHAILPLLATDGGVRLQLATGIAAHRARSGAWGGGLWLPECAHAPWLDPLLEEAGVRAACVDLTDVLGRGAPAQLRPLRSPAGPLLVPIDRAVLELVWSERGYPAHGALPRHAPAHGAPPPGLGGRRRAVRPGARRGAGARATRRTSSPGRPRASRAAGSASRRWTPSCSACTGTRARAGSARCSPPPTPPACGSRRSTTLLAEADPAPAPPLPATRGAARAT